jgi:1-pyrroline-5-carboxylate dehydrogenase
MNNALFSFQKPENEKIKSYLNGSIERRDIDLEIKRQLDTSIEIPLIINGREIYTGDLVEVTCPHDYRHVLAKCHMASEKELKMATEASLNAKEDWMNLSWVERGSILYKAAELISTKYRILLNASTMLGQSKNLYQAEIDSACEVIDFLRFNPWFAAQIYSQQALSDQNVINRMEYRPLEGFVLTVSPFNFTAIALNLNVAVALMGNTTVWKPASTSLLSNYYLMKILMEAGLPPGVVNFVPCKSSVLRSTVFEHTMLAGVHFTGSNASFNSIWNDVTQFLPSYRSYPKIVGETGGKDFVFAHASSDPLELATALVRGSFEYQGQKCSAASRAYIPRSLWDKTKSYMKEMLSEIKMGDVTDHRNFVNAVIDKKSYDNIMAYIETAKNSNEAQIIAGGKGNCDHGWFVEPTIIETQNPYFLTMKEEIFGPVLSVFVYEDARYTETLEICDQTSPYALTGSIFSKDKYAMIQACKKLRYAAGNFYINDKPTGAMVGQQPFGGARASGTNDKSGSYLNLLRWVSPRTIKETLIPPTDYCYPYMQE